MKNKLLHIIYVYLLILGCIPLNVSATHMVGGEINYRCLGNDQYEIMVTVFRDCDTGVPWFDNPASVGVFDINDSLIYDLRLSLRNNDTLDLNLTDPCLVAPPNVCIHTTTYIDTVTLPFIVGGYQIVYQRCCRNQDIVNIVAPTSTGATYSSYLSEQALLTCNSSARFIEWPPVYICAGVPIVYDHSAMDPDGDSIVYELCTPFTGATPSQSMPQPPNNPPYNPVTWQPPYSVDNMLGGPDSLKIDSVTGQLTGTPDVIGVFVVGVCAKEYRNGVLISTTRRDFQYVVGVCGRLVSSAFFAPAIQCDNSLVVNFQNSSTSLGTGFVWAFGDPSTNATSTYPNPSYIYPDTGLYTVTLIADPGTLCADTSTQEIYLQYESISADFDITTANCTDSFFLDITDLTIDSISHIINWDWDFGNGLTDTVPYPTTVYDTSGTYIISLNVLAANGCTANYMDTIVLDLPTVFSADTVGICPGDTAVVLNPGGNPNHTYVWSPANGLSSTTAVSPIASPTGTTVYQVTVTAPNGVDTCILEQDITVIISPPITLDVFRDTFTCQDSIDIVATSNTQLIEWTTDPNFGTILFTGDSIRIPVSTVVRLFVRATNFAGCSVIDTVDVFKRLSPIVVDWTYTILSCDTSFLVQFTDQTTDNSGGAINAWNWDFGDLNTSTLQNPIHTYTQSGSYLVSLDVVTEDGCIGRFEDVVNVNIPQLTNGDTVGICQGNSSVQLNPNGNTTLQYQWSPAATLSSSTAVSPIATPAVPTTYTVTITAINGSDTCTNIQQVHVNFPPSITVTVPSVTIYCGNSVDLLATSSTAISYEWSGDPSFSNIIGTGNPYTAIPVTFPYAGYYVRATDPYGCTATAFALVQQNPVPVDVNFSYQSLGCSDTIAIQFTDLTIDTSTTNPIASWLWTTSDGQSSNVQNPIFVFTQSQPTIVSLQVTLTNGCMGTMTDTLDLNIASLTNDSTVIICNGATSIQLNAGGNSNLSYQWSPGASLSSTSDPEPIATPPSTPFTYTVTVTGQSNLDTCIAVHDITIVQAPPILIEVPKDTIICAGVFNIQANITNAALIQWSFSPTFSPVAVTNVTSFFIGIPNPPFDLVMYVRATDQYGCIEEDTARILRRDIPIPANFTTQINACEDTLDVSFTNTTTFPTGTQFLGYNWDFGNGQTANTVNGQAQYTTNGMHVVSLTAVATNGCSGTFVDTLDYNLPTLNSADSIGLCGADSVQLNTGGSMNLLYQWSPITGLSNPMAASPMASPSATTVYTVSVTAPNGTDTCKAIHQIVVGVDSFVFEAMADTVICINQIELMVNASSTSSVEWALDRDFNLIIGTGNPFVTNVNDARWFYVRGTDNYGCEGLDSVFVNYRGNDIPIDFSMTTVNCEDSLIVQFQDISGDTTITNWNWDLGNGQTSTLQNPMATYYMDSTYTIDLQIEVIGNCRGQISKPLSAQIPVLEVPNANLTTCGNDSIALMIQTNPNLTYVWSPAIGLSDSTISNPMALPSANTTYKVRVYGYSNFGGVLDTCWLEDSIRIVVQPAPLVEIVGDTFSCDSSFSLMATSPQTTSYAWATTSNFQTIIDHDSLFNGWLTATQTAFYVRVEDSLGCVANDSILINGAWVDLDLESSHVRCDNQSIDLIVTNNNPLNNFTYTWSPASSIITGQGTDTVTVYPTTTTNFTVVGINQYGCIDSNQTVVTIGSPLDLTTSDDTLLCQPSLSISASSTQQIVQYTWSSDPNFNNILGQNATIQTNVVNNQHVYYVQIEDSLGCTKIDSVIINYHPVDLIVDSAMIICIETPVQLTAVNLNLGDSLTYQWAPSGDIISGQGTDSIVVMPSASTTYTVIAQNQYGCSSNAQTIVSVSSTNPMLSIGSSQDTVYLGNNVQLMATPQAGYTYTWAANSTLNADSIYNPIATPQATTTYYLTVTDVFGCITTDSIVIHVNDVLCAEPNVFVPNAFTPDGDGNNDVLYVRGTAITDVKLIIYNRWGEQVFQSNDKAVGWDGTFKGKDCLSDVYGYYMECKCLDGNELIKKGNITLLR